MLSHEDYCISLTTLTELEMVKSFKELSPTNYAYELYVNTQEKTLTQEVFVTLVDETFVMAYSPIGLCPRDAETLKSLLAENMDGNYSRLALFDDDLVQIYRYPLEFLEIIELYKALDEVSQLANYAKRCYFGNTN